MTEKGEAEIILKPLAEEIWEIILSKLENSADILNTFNAFPDLEGRVLKNKYAWLIDQVYEHLSPWLSRRDELVCRQVSRRWCRAVDTDMDKSHVPITFDDTDKLTSFLQKMDGHPPSRTPFIGRSVMIYDPGEGVIGAPHYDQNLFWTGAKEIFSKFGSHVHFLNLRANGMENTVQFCQIVLEILRCVPNLTSLELSQYDGDYSEEADEFVESQVNLFPSLPQLERVNFRGNYDSTPDSLIVHLLHRYSLQIRKLGLHIYYWRAEYSHLFPKLEELNLFYSSLEDVTEIMYSLNSPHLKKLSLQLKSGGGGGAVENNIISWLEHSPQIQDLEINIFNLGENIGEDLSFPLATRNIPKLKTLTIKGDVEEIDFTFLECFPSLQRFRVSAYDRPPKYFGRRNLYEPGIWEMLPKLKEFYISKRELRGLPKHFTRAKYDWLKERKKRRMEGPPDVECLFQCFDLMISDNWKGDDGEGDVTEEIEVCSE